MYNININLNNKNMATTEIAALKNAVEYLKLNGLDVLEHYTQDKRKTNKKYFLSLNGTCQSPVLGYEQMNHFILGMIKMKQLC